MFDNRLRLPCSLCAQLLAALCAPTLENVTAILGLHALTETVNLTALSLLGLISAYHR